MGPAFQRVDGALSRRSVGIGAVWTAGELGEIRAGRAVVRPSASALREFATTVQGPVRAARLAEGAGRQSRWGSDPVSFEQRRAEMASDYAVSGGSVIELAERFGSSIHAAFRRYMEPQRSGVAGVVSMELMPD